MKKQNKEYVLPEYKMSPERMEEIINFIKKNNPAPAKSVVLRTLNRLVLWLTDKLEILQLFIYRKRR